jgi:glycosyltransferase involved in cell wall biosynthesis
VITSIHVRPGPPAVSIAIFAWNEERSISSTLRSLFEQSIFGQLRGRAARSEIVCVTNGCTDRTALVAQKTGAELVAQHADHDAFSFRVANIAERGKVNAWNQFVHRLSGSGARVLFMMDADILMGSQDTLWNMLLTLEQHPEATVVVDLPCKDITAKARKSLTDRLSLAASRMTQAADGQLCGQLYCIRAEAARQIFLPKDLAACEDGFIKMMVCTDFLTQPTRPERVRLAQNAWHTFGPYTSPAAILKNQKRQIIGQTIIHLLIDRYLPGLSPVQKRDLVGFLENKDTNDPGWLKGLIRAHIEQTSFFWRLYPGLLANRFTRLRRLDLVQRIRCIPAALAGCGATLVASFFAYQALKRGCTDYWPKANRHGCKSLSAFEQARVSEKLT